MRTIHEIPTPAMLLDLDVLERNLRAMAARARKLGVRLRPHVKTHKCVEIALGQRELGAAGITVSTLEEARVFADAGFEDITWAFPVIAGRIEEAAALARRVRLGVVVDSAAAVESLASAGAPFAVWLKVDAGNGRAGVAPEAPEALDIPRAIVATGLAFAGLLSHSGQAYRARSPDHVRRIAQAERDTVVDLAGRLRDGGVPVPEISVGSTPSMTRAYDLAGVTEARPGNYALFDFTQVALGSCGPDECAATVLSTVVSARPGRGTSVVDAGALALSADTGPAHLGRRSFGEIYEDYGRGTLRQNARLVSLSQEHGVVSRSLPWGSRVRILPNHSCLAVPCFDAFFVVRGEDVLDRWTIHRGR
jgi:D-serine deaminase-like pyridoxal phosphate-dependent protein